MRLTEQGIDFSLDQLPEIAREIVTFGILKHSLGVGIPLLIGTVLTIAAIWLAQKIYAPIDESFDKFSTSLLVGIGGTICTWCFALIPIFVNLNPLLMAVFAPRLFIIEYLRNLV